MADLIGLIFDLDGTLIDSAPDIHATANKVFAEHGFAGFDFVTVRGFIGNGVTTLVARLLAHHDLPDAGDLHTGMVADFIKTYEEAIDLTTLYPNAREAVEVLADRGHPLAICTNKPVGPARSVLRHFGLDRHFAVIVGGDTLPQLKPHPAPLLAARAQLACDRVLFVGDSEVDAETARAANLPFAFFTNGYCNSPAESLMATATFDDFGALPDLVTHVSGRL